MTPQVKDIVEVRRPRLPSRIGTVVRRSSKGLRAYVYFGGKNRRGKRYADVSLLVLVRTGVKIAP